MNKSISSREILSTPNIGDGNPSTVIALSKQAEMLGKDPTTTYLQTTSRPANLFHKRMTADPKSTDTYASDSEEKRVNLPARLYAKASFVEFALRLACNGNFDMNTEHRWNAVQEHQLLGANQEILKYLGINDVRLVIPDVYPKESALAAARHLPNVGISVWNKDAKDELAEQGFAAKLHKPYMLDGFAPNLEDFERRGVEAVIKSSGSGMPSSWVESIKKAFSNADSDFAMHAQTHRSTQDTATIYNDQESRISGFYEDLGGKTKLLIGYPSELVGVVFDMRSRGVPVWMATLPPRGSHEKRNLRFALDHNLVIGEVRFDKKRQPTFEDASPISAKDLPDILGDLPTPPTQRDGVIGTQLFWID